MKSLMGTLLGTLVSVGLLSAQVHAMPYPDAATPQPVDLGALDTLTDSTPVTFTVALRLPNIDDAESLLKSINSPGDPQYHKFLSASEFVTRFAPSAASVAQVIAALEKYGLRVEQTTATTLKVTGLPGDIERAFAVSLHNYAVPAHGNVEGYTFHAPLTHPTIPSEILSSVAAVVGLDSRAGFRPHFRIAPAAMARGSSTPPGAATGTTTGNAPGLLTVTDFVNLYDVAPLYSRGVSGSGRTLAIMTLASFTPSDAFAYWNALGLSVNSGRIRVVNVDGGPGAPSDVSGSAETTLDVEQSGGIAPGAKIIVYQAPNTDQGFVDMFASAIDADAAQSLSTSWGAWEWFSNFENGAVTDPSSGRTISSIQAIHELLVRAAIQGQSIFTSAGDGGAYDVQDTLGCYGPYSPKVPTSCSQPLSVDYPASDTAITAAGGTTLPGVQELCLNAACTKTYNVDVPHERVWGWDYLVGFCNAIGENPTACGIFPGGGGGGVSIMNAEPDYQYGVSGVQHSQYGQVYQAGVTAAQGYAQFYVLPSNYAGRNVPDLSFNADPDTGYIIYYTSSVSGPEVLTYVGGTSFVAPQLNGVSALLGQYLNAREGLGLLNNELYGLALTGQAYAGPAAPLHAIAYGDNWFYYGRYGYNPGAGLGTLDVYNFAELMRYQF